MATPTTVDIPHNLGRDEVRRRLDARIGDIAAQIPGGQVRSAWTGPYSIALDVAALGQQIAVSLEVEERRVRVRFTLPPMLSFMTGAIEAALRRKGDQLLLG
jgi:hypothetical protein